MNALTELDDVIAYSPSDTLSIGELVRKFRAVNAALIQRKDAEFPWGAVVAHGHTYGVVTSWDGCPADKLALRFENDNVWFKPVEDCQRIDVREAPRWVRRMKLSQRGYRLLNPYKRPQLP